MMFRKLVMTCCLVVFVSGLIGCGRCKVAKKEPQPKVVITECVRRAWHNDRSFEALNTIVNGHLDPWYYRVIPQAEVEYLLGKPNGHVETNERNWVYLTQGADTDRSALFVHFNHFGNMEYYKWVDPRNVD